MAVDSKTNTTTTLASLFLQHKFNLGTCTELHIRDKGWRRGEAGGGGGGVKTFAVKYFPKSASAKVADYEHGPEIAFREVCELDLYGKPSDTQCVG